MNQQHNIQSNGTKKTHTFVKISFAIFFSLLLLTTSLTLNAHKTYAASSAPNAVNVSSASSMTDIIRQVFGVYSDQAIRIATCELSLNPNAINSYAIGNSHAEGLFQILYPSTWYGTSEANASPYDPVANTRAAYQIFSRDGYSWREWECQP